MLQLAKDYVPLVKRKQPVDPSYQHGVQNEYELAKSIDKSRNYFKTPNKINRLRSILGSGDKAKGDKKLMCIVEDTIKEYNQMCETLQNRPWGFKILDHLQGKSTSYTQKLAYQIDLHGMTTYKKLMSAHKVLKHFRKLEKIRQKALQYIPLDKRLPLTEKFVKKYYWKEKLTTKMLADALAVPEVWVQKEVNRLGLQKKANGIKYRGKKGFVMPEEQKVKHQNQPHARAVVQICPRTFTVLRTFNSTGAVERDGWSRENVRKAIRNAGLHDGFLWAHVGEEQKMITRAKAKGDLAKKLKIWENGAIPKETIQELYINQNLTKEVIAEMLGCHPSTVACVASRHGIRKRQKKVSTETLKRLYLDEGKSVAQIAAMTDYPPKTISTYLSRRGITKLKKKQI